MINLKTIPLKSYINYIFVLYAFLVPLSRGGITGLTALLFVLWLFTDNFKEKINFLKTNKVIIYLIAFVLFNLLSLLWSEDVSSGLYYIRKYWYFLPIIVIATTVEKRFLEYGISAFLASMLLSEILSYGIFFELWSLKHGSPDFPTPFMGHIPYSMFLAFTSLLLLNKSFYENQIKYKLMYLLFFSTVTANLFLNAGRTGQAAFILTIFVLLFLKIKNKILAFFGTLLFITFVLYAAYQVSPNFKVRVAAGVNDITQIIEDKEYRSSIGLRFAVWYVGSKIFIENPILGTGATCEMNSMHEYIQTKDESFKFLEFMPSYHNNYVQLAVDLGVIGLFLFFMIFYNILKLNLHNKEYFNLLVIFVGIFYISCIFSDLFHNQFGEALFALFVGIFIAQHRIENEA